MGYTKKGVLNINLTIIFILFITNLYTQQSLKRIFQPSNVINKIPYGANISLGKYAQTKDAKIYYEVYGNGQPIVLLHGGLFGSTIEYADLIDKLKRSFQVIAISTRGHGKSELGKEPLTLEQRATDVLTVINSVTKDSVIVIGFSDGGYTAYKFGAMYPNRVKKMIVIGAAELKPGLRKFNMNAKVALELDKTYWQQQLKLMPEPDRLEEVFTQVNNFYKQLTVSKDLLNQIKCPVLLIAGDKDEENPISRILSAASYIQNHQVCIIPNAKHVCFNDNFAVAWESILPFIDNSKKEYLNFNNNNIEPYQVVYSLQELDNFNTIKVIKDTSVKLFDEPCFVKIKNKNFLDGEIEVKVLSKLLPNSPEFARGFIGIAFRICADNSKFEAIYLRPANGRSESQIRRNHSIQYFSYPNYKFNRLRIDSPGEYESYSDMALNEWITMKIIVKGNTAKLFLNENLEPSLIVNDLKLSGYSAGNIGLWVETGTEGYFRDLKITNY